MDLTGEERGRGVHSPDVHRGSGSGEKGAARGTGHCEQRIVCFLLRISGTAAPDDGSLQV